MSDRLSGTVKFFDDDKGYGFIVGADGADAFIHKTQLTGCSSLPNGALVTYEVVRTSKGNGVKAVNVQLA